MSIQLRMTTEMRRGDLILMVHAKDSEIVATYLKKLSGLGAMEHCKLGDLDTILKAASHIDTEKHKAIIETSDKPAPEQKDIDKKEATVSTLIERILNVIKEYKG